jgi:protease IV
VQLGLVDELRSPSSIAREVVKAEEMIDYTVEEGIADRLAKRIGVSVGVSLGLVWGRYCLGVVWGRGFGK